MWFVGPDRLQKRMADVILQADRMTGGRASPLAQAAYLAGYRDGIRAAGLYLMEEVAGKVLRQNDVLHELFCDLEPVLPTVDDVLAVEQEVWE